MAPPPTTVALHVGAHKTGTSLVQAYLRADRDELEGLGLAVIDRDDLSTFVDWGRRLISDPTAFGSHLARLAEGAGVHTIFGSNENALGRPFDLGGDQLYPAAPKVIDALRPILAPYRAKILFSIRPQADFLESYYLQSIHQGGHDTFETWLGRLDLDALSWRPIVDELHAAFGVDGVELIDFGRIRRGAGDFLRHVLSRVDPGFDHPIEFEETRNPSVSEKGLRIALAANPLLQTGSERRMMRVFLQKHFSNQHYPRPTLLTDAQRAELGARYDPEYAALFGDAPDAESA